MPLLVGMDGREARGPEGAWNTDKAEAQARTALEPLADALLPDDFAASIPAIRSMLAARLAGVAVTAEGTSLSESPIRARLVENAVRSIDPSSLNDASLMALARMLRPARPAGDRPPGMFLVPLDIVELICHLVRARAPYSKTLTGGTATDLCPADMAPLLLVGEACGTRTCYLGDSPEALDRSALVSLELSIETGMSADACLPHDLSTPVSRRCSLVVSMPPANRPAPAVAITDLAGAEPPSRNANLTWIGAALAALDEPGLAALLVPNDVLWTVDRQEQEAKHALVDAGLIECVVALPAHTLSGTSLGVSLMLLSRGRPGQETLMLDASASRGWDASAGRSRLSPEAIAGCADTYAQWLARETTGEDGPFAAPGRCRSVTPEDIAARKFLLAPDAYVDDLGPARLHARPAARILAEMREMNRLAREAANALDAIVGREKGGL